MGALPVVLLALLAQGRPPDFGGGPVAAAPPDASCVSDAERARAEGAFSGMRALAAAPGPAPYPFFPQAGTMWEDLFLLNYVDLDPTSAARDFSCGDWTYDNHQGEDSDIAGFRRQEIGVPVFAALDGVVLAAHDG